MAGMKKYIAIDLGAESGRVMLGSLSRKKMSLEEVQRFNNGPIQEKGSLRWDFGQLLLKVKVGIRKAVKKAGDRIEGIGVDTWGVDFGLIGDDGKLIENPYHYRDNRTDGIMQKAFELISKRQIYENTGIQFMQLNSVYQLLAMRLVNSDVLANAKKLIFMADLISYYLCGQVFGEYTLASTSQLMDTRMGKWSEQMFNKLGLPIDIMPDIVEPGTIVGQLSKQVAEELDCDQIPIIATASHDTASAVAAVPATDERWAYLSSGTWSLMGIEVPNAIINDRTFKYEFTNEGGIENTIRLLKNIMGLWLVQECKRQWQQQGQDLSYVQLSRMAEKAEPFAGHIDVDQSEFLAPGDMPKRINEYLSKTGQVTTNDKGQMIRILLESLALKYRSVMEAIEDVAGYKIDILHIVGGGIQNELLCQFTANALGKKVVTGPIEATASGNILMQARATGQVKSLAEVREIVRNSFDLKEYQPQESEIWL
jgi:rhamnulokinase